MMSSNLHTIVSGSVDAQVDPSEPPDLTGELKLVRIAGTGSLSVVYRCSYNAQSMDVAVKAITFPPNFHPTDKEEFMQKVRREFVIWGKLKHPNIVTLLGTAYGREFGSDLPCIVSRWMTNGTLNEYVKQHETNLSLSDRIRLIKGSVAGLEYLHSKGIVHGDLHPANILIDGDYNPRLTDLGLSPSPSPMQDQLSYLWTDSIRPGGALWAAPEILYPELYPNLKLQAALHSDIYPLGGIILFILSGQHPWRDRGEAENKLKKFQNPLRPTWPVNMPDGVWDFIEQCWSPRDPGSRPSAKATLSFCTDRLQQLLRPNPSSDINVVLFGPLGSGKSSIINLLAGEQIALESSGVEPCTERPRSYQVSMNERQFQLWDTMGFFIAPDGPASHLSPYEHAHAVLRNLPDGVNLILLCADKGTISPSLRRLYWLINHFFYGGRAPIAFVVTHFDTPDEEWWDRNKRDIAERTSIPVQSIPHACVTTDPTAIDQSRYALKELLRTYATAVAPIPIRLDISSHTTAISDLATHCRLSDPEASTLVKKFSRPLRPLNVVIFGETGAELSSVINLIVGHTVTGTSLRVKTHTSRSRPYRIHTGTQEFRIWDTMDLHEAHTGQDAYTQASENARQLIHNLSGEGGVDLLVFSKRFGKLTQAELKVYRSFEGTLCKGQCPVAVIVTHFESQYPTEKWWEMNGKELVKAIGGDVVGHACIAPLPRYDPGEVKLDKRVVESRALIHAMLEDCVSSHRTRLPRMKVEEVWTSFPLKMIARRSVARPRNRTV